MRYEDEPYIRLYKRETPEWTLLPWEARVLHPYILKHMDRVGVLELGKSRWKALASALRVPLEVLGTVMPILLEDGCLTLAPDGKGGEVLFSPNFMEAQEAKTTDAGRKRAERERARDRMRAVTLGLLTPPDGQHRPKSDELVPKQDVGVLKRPKASQPVTTGHSYLSELTKPTQLLPPEGEEAVAEESEAKKLATANDDASGFGLALRVWSELWGRKYGEKFQITLDQSPSGDERTLQRIGELSRAHGEHAEAVLRHKVKTYLGNGEAFYANKRHEVQLLERRWNTWGMPPKARTTPSAPLAKAEPPAPPPTPEEIRAQQDRIGGLVKGIGKEPAGRAGRGGSS